MTKKSSRRYILPKNRDMERLFNQLTRYPVANGPSRLMQDLGRCRTIRNLKREGLQISKGRVTLPQHIKIIQDGKGFRFVRK